MAAALDRETYLETVVSIPVTPFDAERNVDYEALTDPLDHMIDAGIETVVPCGNTSEFYSLTRAESKKVVAQTCDHAHTRREEDVAVIAGVGYALDTALDLARHAEQAGADAVMVHDPVHPFYSGAGYRAYVETLAEAVDVSVIPYVRGTNVADETLLALAAHEGVVGVKYAVNDVQRVRGLITNTPADTNVTWICGTAEAWAPFFFAAGATGFTSGLTNVAPALSLRMLRGLQTGDWAAAWAVWEQLKPFEGLRARDQSAHNVSVVKEAMAQQGLGSRRVRPPLSELEAADRETVQQMLARWGDDG
jgi:4-hydroxy-tetrahydrodipicolinate synthase